jgi:hypothetical protein
VYVGNGSVHNSKFKEGKGKGEKGECKSKNEKSGSVFNLNRFF